MSYVQLSEGRFQVVYPLGLWSGFPELSKSDSDMASKLFTSTFYITPLCRETTSPCVGMLAQVEARRLDQDWSVLT